MHEIVKRHEFKKDGREIVHFPLVKRFSDIEDVFNNADELLDGIPKDQRVNYYFTVNQVDVDPDQPDKARKVWVAQDIIPIDIDDPDLDKLEETIQTILPVLKVNYLDVAIICSGNGIQIFIKTTKSFDKDKFKEWRPYYKELCAKVNKALRDKELDGHMDPAVWSDNRIMRLPNTINKKKGRPPKETYVIQSNLTPLDYELPNIVDLPPGLTSESINKAALKRLPPADTEAVLSECEFLKWMKDNPNEVNEEQWFAGLSVLSFLENGRSLCHEYSEGHRDYSYDETDYKYEHIRNSDTGPRTCKDIEDRFPQNASPCLECPHYCKPEVASPYRIQGKGYIETINTKFHEFNVLKDGQQKIKKTQPSFEDVKRYFSKKHEYVSDENGNIWIFNKTHWELFPYSKFRVWVKQHCFEDLYRELKAKEAFQYLTTDNPVDEEFFQSTEGMFNFQNGVLNFEDMSFQASSSNFGFTYTLPYEYDPEAECPQFKKFMKDVTCGDNLVSHAIMEFVAYSFSGMKCKLQKALILHGTGANGKSVLVNVIQALAGKDAYSTLLLSDLENPERRSHLIGKLFNIAEESPRYMRSPETFKNLVTGGDYVVNQKYRDSYTITNNRTKLIFSCNELPATGDLSYGLIRRMLIVPFDALFVEGHNADPDIVEKLLEELPGIFNLVVRAYSRIVKKNKFTNSASIQEAVNAYKHEQNPLAGFVYERMEKSEEQEQYYSNDDIYKIYMDYCDEFRMKSRMNKTSFGKQLTLILKAKSDVVKINGRPTRGRNHVRIFDKDMKMIQPSTLRNEF